MNFMAMILTVCQGGAGRVCRPFEAGKDHAGEYKVQDYSGHMLR